MAPTAGELLAAVERSPQAAAAHDRAGWVGLFTEDGRVEDPVGSRPQVGHAQIGRFYDTFIGPRQITFHPDVDIVAHTSVIRDVTLEVAMGSGVRLMVPTFIRYDLRAVGGDWKITDLRAYWELPVMLTAFLRNGVHSLPVGLRLCSALLRNQGLRGSAGYLGALRGPGNGGKRLVEQALSGGGLHPELRECRWHKLIAAGHTVAAAVVSPSGPGVVFADVDARGTGIIRTEYFCNVG